MGALCQRNKLYYDISDTINLSDPFDFPEREVLKSITPIDNTSWTFQFSNPSNLFKGEYSRIAPFILAQGRKIISKTIEPYKDKVRRIHTDGFILSEESTKPPLINCPKDASVTLKALKFEKKCNYYIKNANQIVWL